MEYRREYLPDRLCMNLIEDPKDYHRYYMHSVSHHLGMDTHDLGLRTSTLEAGNVITVEPGIYIPEENIGVRIEEDVLVTEAGYCVLSQHIPKEVEELEEIRSAALGVE
jgi:Xaa-Pro aminopeptidase